MKALVTGGAGFIGSNIVERLLGLGHKPVVLDNISSGYRETSCWAWPSSKVTCAAARRSAPRSTAAEWSCISLLASATPAPSPTRRPTRPSTSSARSTSSKLHACRTSTVPPPPLASLASARPCPSPRITPGPRIAVRHEQARGREDVPRLQQALRHAQRVPALLQRVRTEAGSHLAVQRRRAAVHATGSRGRRPGHVRRRRSIA